MIGELYLSVTVNLDSNGITWWDIFLLSYCSNAKNMLEEAHVSSTGRENICSRKVNYSASSN